jgi:hypothetical protein
VNSTVTAVLSALELEAVDLTIGESWLGLKD